MKKIILSIALSTLFAAAFFGCAQKKAWTPDERQAMTRGLTGYQKMIYLDDLTDNEFALFASQVTASLESTYPNYTKFLDMSGAADSIQSVVIRTVSQELTADAGNLVHLFPYNQLVAIELLPTDLVPEQIDAFYNCLSRKIGAEYGDMTHFYNLLIEDESYMTEALRKMQSQCANDLFNWIAPEPSVSEPVK